MGLGSGALQVCARFRGTRCFRGRKMRGKMGGVVCVFSSTPRCTTRYAGVGWRCLFRGPPSPSLHVSLRGSQGLPWRNIHFGVWRSPPDLSVGWDAGVKTGLLPPVCLLRDCTSLTESHRGSAGRQHVGQGASPSCRCV